jgi:hypothetical protein
MPFRLRSGQLERLKPRRECVRLDGADSGFQLLTEEDISAVIYSHLFMYIQQH